MHETNAEVEITDVQYACHDGIVLLARLFRPVVVAAPTPALIDVHGGAWTTGTRHGNEQISFRLARAGIFVMAIDYRLPPDGHYPASVQDVNIAVRWLKSSATRYGVDALRIGILGTSSGGHLAVLAALKPLERRYSPVLPGDRRDARVPFVVALWPVICPLSRYRDVVLAGGDHGPHSDRAGSSPQQMTYWGSEEAMDDGSPLLAVTRGDDIDFPEILYVQNPGDTLHPLASAERFVRAYRSRGGRIEMHLFRGEAYNLVRTEPDSDEARKALQAIVRFVQDPSRPVR